jgi:hypothetical protein
VEGRKTFLAQEALEYLTIYISQNWPRGKTVHLSTETFKVSCIFIYIIFQNQKLKIYIGLTCHNFTQP